MKSRGNPRSRSAPALASDEELPSHLRLFTLETVSEITGFSPSTLRRAIRRRNLACIRCGRAIRISEADLTAFLTRHRKAAR